MNCAACKGHLAHNDEQWHSSVFRSNHVLCKPCGLAEEKAIEDEGTNDLPTLLKTYGTPNAED